MLALRMFLIGTEQGVQLRNLMTKLPAQNIFDENTDPRNKPFTDDYLSTLKTCMTFETPLMEVSIIPAIKKIMILKEVGFFGATSANCQDGAAVQPVPVCLIFLIFTVGTIIVNRYARRIPEKICLMRGML
jgi:hypothetical protein